MKTVFMFILSIYLNESKNTLNKTIFKQILFYLLNAEIKHSKVGREIFMIEIHFIHLCKFDTINITFAQIQH